MDVGHAQLYFDETELCNDSFQVGPTKMVQFVLRVLARSRHLRRRTSPAPVKPFVIDPNAGEQAKRPQNSDGNEDDEIFKVVWGVRPPSPQRYSLTLSKYP